MAKTRGQTAPSTKTPGRTPAPTPGQSNPREVLAFVEWPEEFARDVGRNVSADNPGSHTEGVFRTEAIGQPGERRQSADKRGANHLRGENPMAIRGARGEAGEHGVTEARTESFAIALVIDCVLVQGSGDHLLRAVLNHVDAERRAETVYRIRSCPGPSQESYFPPGRFPQPRDPVQ